MGNFTQKSKIEFFRLKRHGAHSLFRFLRDSPSGYVVAATLTSGFYINRRFSSEAGALLTRLTFDAPSGFSFSSVENCYFGDLVYENGTFDRYSLTAETPPTARLENRFRFLLTAHFGDQTPLAL